MFDLLDLKSRSSARKFLPFAACFGMLLLPGVADAKTVFVNGSITKPGNGTSWSTAFKYLRDALDQTSTGDQIYVAKGTYFPDDGKSGFFGDREMSFELNGQKIYGGYAGTGANPSQRNPSVNTTILSGAIWGGANASDFYSLHVVTVEKNSTLDGVIVEDGHANGGHVWNYPNIGSYDEGGGCYVESGNTLTLANCTFRNNRALADGGAIMIEGRKGKVIASNCTFEGNEIPSGYNVTRGKSAGGAIYGNVEATNCKFRENVVRVIQAFEGNESVASGGAISGEVKALGCEFTSNAAVAYTDDEDVEPTSDGGAIHGNFSGTSCVFTGNAAVVLGGVGVSSGGAISGAKVAAFNCTFVQNAGGIGIDESLGNSEPEGGEPPKTEPVPGGGGAVYAAGGGESKLANCVFVRNSSLFRGGAVQGGVKTSEDSLFIHNCTFLDNAVAEEKFGPALSCGGVVRILNNIFWYTAETSGTYEQDKPIHISFKGALRNSDENYPTPSSAAPNIIKGGYSSITKSIVTDLFLVSPSILVLDADPLFADIADPDGADNRWGTADDGLRLSAGSPAIGAPIDPRVPNFVNVLPLDIRDLDGDGNVKERLPIDLKGNVRVQGGHVELGAYEYGNKANAAEIAVVEGKKELTDGGSRNFGQVKRLKKKEFTFTIKNTGTNGLGNIAFTLTGSKDFTIRKANIKAIEPGAQATFTVSFRPKKAGNYSAKLSILSNDADESPFDITLTGKCPGKKSTGKKAGTKTKTPKVTDLVTKGSGTTIPGFFLASAPAANAVTTTSTGADGEKYLTITIAKSVGWNGGTVEVSSDLQDWHSGKKHTTVLEDSATLLRVRDNTPVAAGQKRYIRLK